MTNDATTFGKQRRFSNNFENYARVEKYSSSILVGGRNSTKSFVLWQQPSKRHSSVDESIKAGGSPKGLLLGSVLSDSAASILSMKQKDALKNS